MARRAGTGATPGSTNYTSEQWNGGDLLKAFGVVNLGARLYDPVIGRFLSRDPLISARNPYGFADNDPVNKSDPTGLKPCDGQENTNCDPAGTPPTLSNSDLQKLADANPIYVDGGCSSQECRDMALYGPFYGPGKPLLSRPGPLGGPGGYGTSNGSWPGGAGGPMTNRPCNGPPGYCPRLRTASNESGDRYTARTGYDAPDRLNPGAIGVELLIFEAEVSRLAGPWLVDWFNCRVFGAGPGCGPMQVQIQGGQGGGGNPFRAPGRAADVDTLPAEGLIKRGSGYDYIVDGVKVGGIELQVSTRTPGLLRMFPGVEPGATWGNLHEMIEAALKTAQGEGVHTVKLFLGANSGMQAAATRSLTRLGFNVTARVGGEVVTETVLTAIRVVSEVE